MTANTTAATYSEDNCDYRFVDNEQTDGKGARMTWILACVAAVYVAAYLACKALEREQRKLKRSLRELEAREARTAGGSDE